MVLILSDHADYSTNFVIKWLDYYKVKWMKINETDSVTFKSLEYNHNKISKFIINVNGYDLNLAKLEGYWYRRGRLNYPYKQKNNVSEDIVINENILMHLRSESNNILRFVYKYLYCYKVSVNSFLHSTNDKSYYQFVAAEIGLNVPDTLICTCKQDLIIFLKQKSKLVGKSINELFSFEANNKNYYATTYTIDEKDIEKSETFFFPSLFQKYIEKFIEIRSFYLKGNIYSMAIFSQQNEKTKIDFRNYDHKHPNRNVPFKLPSEIEKKITVFMKKIDINCGSIDIILTPENEFYFLEVNPVGQFGMVSVPCNYFIEKKIAKSLMNVK